MYEGNINILIIEDDKKYIAWMKDILSSLGDVNIDEGYSESDFYKHFKPGKYNLIILDLRLKSNYEGMELLKFSMDEDPEAPIIILTGYASVKTAIQSLQLGAKDYLEKKYFTDDEKKFTKEFLKKVNKIIIEDKAKKLLEKKQKESFPIKPIIGENINVKQIMEFADLFAEKKISPVFLIGEFGTEKELLAEYIYKKSGARGKFIKKINASKNIDISEELFGKDKNQGLIEAARGGVFYLENIFNLESKSKKYLLDFINTGILRKTPPEKEIKINTQIILSTYPVYSQDFSNDEIDRKLYFRVKTAAIVIPALRERVDDIQLIAQYFLNLLNREGKISVENFSDDAIESLKAYLWPGNVFELKHVVESSALQAEINNNNIIKIEHLPFDPYGNITNNNGSESINLDKILCETFLKYLQISIEKSGGAKLKAYEYLGYSQNQRGTLNTRIKKSFKTYPDFKIKYPDIHKIFIN